MGQKENDGIDKKAEKSSGFYILEGCRVTTASEWVGGEDHAPSAPKRASTGVWISTELTRYRWLYPSVTGNASQKMQPGFKKKQQGKH